jgi:La-related protein 7
VEYYFSDENLPTDEFMLKFVKKNKDGFGNGKYSVISSGHLRRLF